MRTAFAPKDVHHKPETFGLYGEISTANIESVATISMNQRIGFLLFHFMAVKRLITSRGALHLQDLECVFGTVPISANIK